jgi:hypothetical protein
LLQSAVVVAAGFTNWQSVAARHKLRRKKLSTGNYQAGVAFQYERKSAKFYGLLRAARCFSKMGNPRNDAANRQTPTGARRGTWHLA